MASAIRTGFAQRPSTVGSKLVVYKNYDPQSTKNKNVLAPVATGVDVLSGMVCRLKKHATLPHYEVVLPGAVGAVGVPFFALDDCTSLLAGSANGNIGYDVSRTKLTGLPVDGDYELGTSKFSTGTYTVGTYITFDEATPGNIKVGVLGTDDIIGQVSGPTDSPINIYPEDNTAAPTITITGTVPNQTATKTSNVVRFRTMWIPAQ